MSANSLVGGINGMLSDISEALSALEAAETVYAESTGEASDEAWLVLQAARQRLSRLIKEAKKRQTA